MKERFLVRGKRNFNREWVKGFLITSFTGISYVVIGFDHIMSNLAKFEIDENTICQSTGLHDSTRWEELTCEEQKQFLSSVNVKENRKNQESDWQGKLIFEGDILAAYLDDKNPNDVTYARVVWDRNAWCIQEAGSFDLHLLEEDIEEDYKIVGNIFDNPELVELLEEEV